MPAPDWSLVLLSLLAPPRCPHCGSGRSALEPLCPSCRRVLAPRPLSPPLGIDRAWALGSFDGLLRDAVHRLKFDGDVWRGRPLGAHLGASLQRHFEGRWDVVVPAPTTRQRLRERGYDQADRIARGVAAALGLPVRRVLARTDAGRQSERSRQERAAIEAVMTASRLDERRVLVVDDVVTTGATLSAAAHRLREQGAVRVDAAALAWTRRRAAASPRASRA